MKRFLALAVLLIATCPLMAEDWDQFISQDLDGRWEKQIKLLMKNRYPCQEFRRGSFSGECRCEACLTRRQENRGRPFNVWHIENPIDKPAWVQREEDTSLRMLNRHWLLRQ